MFVFTVPWQNTLVVSGLGTISRLAGLLLVPLAAACLLLEGRRHRLTQTHLLIAAYALWVCASYFWSIDPSLSFSRIATMLQILAMVLIMWEFARDEVDQRRLLWSWVIGSYVSCVNTYSTFARESEESFRFTAEGFNANGLGLILALGVPIAAYLARSQRGGHVWAVRIYPFVAVPAIILTASRGALLTLIPAAAIVFIGDQKLSTRLRPIVIGIVAVAVVLQADIVPQGTIDRLAAIPAEFQEGEFSGRTELWEAARAGVEDSPLIGAGAGSATLLIEGSTGRSAGAHNSYLSIALESGGIGLGLFALIIVSIGVDAARWPMQKRIFVFVLMATLLVGITPLRYEYQKVTWVIIAFLIGQRPRLATEELSRV